MGTVFYPTVVAGHFSLASLNHEMSTFGEHGVYYM